VESGSLTAAEKSDMLEQLGTKVELLDKEIEMVGISTLVASAPTSMHAPPPLPGAAMLTRAPCCACLAGEDEWEGQKG
jgi:hypothetical protein